MISESEGYTKTLGIEWNAKLDHFRLTVSELPPLKEITKRFLVSDISKVYDVLGWFSPSIIKVKILLQKVWERRSAGMMRYRQTYLRHGYDGGKN